LADLYGGDVSPWPLHFLKCVGVPYRHRPHTRERIGPSISYPRIRWCLVCSDRTSSSCLYAFSRKDAVFLFSTEIRCSFCPAPSLELSADSFRVFPRWRTRHDLDFATVGSEKLSQESLNVRTRSVAPDRGSLIVLIPSRLGDRCCVEGFIATRSRSLSFHCGRVAMPRPHNH
jgi:hypothetical protein